jgi:hypothetical protein
MNDQKRTILIVVAVVAAVALAIWSGLRAFPPGGGGKAVGSLGDLSGERGASGAPTGAQPPGVSPRDRDVSGR